MKTCSQCHSTDLIRYAASEFYSAGWCCLECGHSTSKPTMTYRQFTARLNDLLTDKRATYQAERKLEKSLDRLSYSSAKRYAVREQIRILISHARYLDKLIFQLEINYQYYARVYRETSEK